MSDLVFKLSVISSVGLPLNFKDDDKSGINLAYTAALSKLLLERRTVVPNNFDFQGSVLQNITWNGLSLGIKYPVGSLKFVDGMSYKFRNAFGYIKDLRVNNKTPEVFAAPEVFHNGGSFYNY